MTLQTIRIIVSGKVQGVFYRKYAFETAIQLGIDGFVMNGPDGKVIIEATGENQQVSELVQWCHTGSPKSTVEHVEIIELPDKDYQGFTIRY
jgi:acylphosphatase